MPDTSVKVVCRFRPPNERELQENTDAKASGTSLDFLDATSLQVTQPGSAPQLFTFDRVFHSDSSQIEVFESTIRDTIDDVIQGYNGTIFAYGQTGAGKSFSMFGPDISEEEKMGIIPRACRHIFQYISQCTDGTEFTIKCSFLEIYKEIIKDLLNPKNSNLKIRESPQRGVWVEGLTELFVTCEQDVLDLIRMGERFRKVAFTKMNATSSRSHSLFILQLMQKSPDGSTKTGKLNLADLAGSEKISKTGATGETLEEAKKINLSLSALGNCINALSTRQKHIPYRDSTLTFVLRESLGGNSKTTLLIACSPHVFNMEETISTLRFGQRAKSIKLNVKVNQQRSVAELEMLVAQLQRDLNKLRFYTRRLEEELRQARGADFDLDMFRKRIMLDYREEGEEPSTPSSPSTPTKSALMSPPTSAPGTPMSPRALSLGVAVPPSPGVDYLDPMALAESRLAYEKMKQQLEFKIQDLMDEIKVLKDNASEGSKETIKELEEQMQELRSEGDKLAYELNQKDLEMETLLSELAAAKDRADEMERQAARANDQILALQAANEALSHEKSQLSSTIKSLQESLQSSKNQLTLLEHTASQHGREKESIQTLLREREDQYRALQQQLIETRAQNDDLVANEEEIQLQLRLMRQEKEVVDAALSSARSRLASLETTSQEKQEKVVVISENADKLRDDNSILVKKLATLEAEHEKMRTEMRNKDQQLQNERNKSKQQAEALRQASAQLREKQMELQTLQLETSVKLSQAGNDFLNEKNLRLQAEKELERTRRLLEEKEKVESTLSDNLSKTTKELQQERTKSGVQAKQIQESARRISDLDRELNLLRTENRSLREDLGLDPSEMYKGNSADGKNGSNDSSGNVDVVAEVRQWLGRVRRRSSLAVPVTAGSLAGATTPQSSNNVAVPVGQQSAKEFLASARAAGQTGAATTSPGTSSNDIATGSGGDALTTPFSSSSSSRSSLSGFFVSSGSSGSAPPEKKAEEESKSGMLTVLEGTTWTVRFCTAQGTKLRICADRKSQSTVLSEMNLAGLSLFKADKFSKKPNSFGLGLKASTEAKFFVAQNDDACDEWIQFLTTSCGLPIVS